MEFKEWLKEGKKEISDAVNADLDTLNARQRVLVPIYLQYKLFKESKKLVIATWVLAGITGLLAIITLIVSLGGN
jgi:hypothetical protein